MGVKNPGVKLNPAWMTDERLTAADLGLLAYLGTRPKNWIAKTADLRQRFSLGRDAFRKIVVHLEELGYLEKYATRTAGMWAGSGYLLRDPLEAPSDDRGPGNPHLISRKTLAPQERDLPAEQVPEGQKTRPAAKTPETTSQALRVSAETRANRYGAEKIIRQGMAEFSLTAAEVADQLIALGTNGRGVTMNNMRAAFAAAAESVSTEDTGERVPAWAKGMDLAEFRLVMHFESLRVDNPEASTALAVLEDIARRTGMPVNYGHVRHWHETLSEIPALTPEEAVAAAATVEGTPKAHEVALAVRRARRPSPWEEAASAPDSWTGPTDEYRKIRAEILAAREARLAAGALI